MGTKTFLWWALGLSVVGIWCVKDGWFPSAAVLEKHPTPEDSFYQFNKLVGGLTSIAALVCAYVHRVVK